MGDLPNLPVTVATDWWAIIVVGFLSVLGTVAGVYLGISLGLKKFRTERTWEKKTEIYSELYKKLKKDIHRFHNSEDEIITSPETWSGYMSVRYYEIHGFMDENMFWINSELIKSFESVRHIFQEHHKYQNDNFEEWPFSADESMTVLSAYEATYELLLKIVKDELGI